MAMALAAIEATFGESLLVQVFKALSSRFGGEAEDLPEGEVQRLVDLARGGDRIAGQRLYREIVDRVYRTVRGIVPSDADAEDVTQDTMLTVLTSLDNYAHRSGTRFIAWVTTIAVNTARRRYRRPKPEIPIFGDLLEKPDPSIDLELDVEARQERSALLQALADLSRSERDIVCFRYGADLNASEIAEIVKLQPANVRKTLERARGRLREQIETVMGNVGTGDSQ